MPLYITLWLFSALLLCFTAARLNYTLHLPKGDPLNAGVDFYDPIVAELLVCSILALGFAPFVLGLINGLNGHTSIEMSASVIEVIALAILWLLWLIGSAVASNIWPNLSFCYKFEACRILAAMTAFAWLGWLTICGLLIVGAFPLVQKKRAPAGSGMVEWVVPAAPVSSQV